MQPELIVDLDAIATNWRSLAAVHGAPTAAVVKADAYGLGAVAIAARLRAEGAQWFFVAQLGEAVALRPVLPGVSIGVLNGFAAAEAGAYTTHDLVPALGNLGEIAAYQAFAKRLGQALPALLHVDTGMNRLGLSAAELANVTDDPSRLAGIEFRYAMTHLISSEVPEDPANVAQLARFETACAGLPRMRRSIANSSGIFLGAKYRSDLARPGAALYGVNPTPGRNNPMQPTVRLTAPVLQVRDIAVGEGVGYNSLWIASRPSRVATVALGYADGYHRAASGRAVAAFDGARVPLIGRISMDLMTFDATDHPTLRPGSRLELIGPAVPPDEVAGWAGTNGYEVLTSLGHRARRIYGCL
ncbi:MAG TPA: alanine racemase [Acetobacteraceae bacterium]|nr:alanine racemase [Acetobacteraceae bacterium]